LSGHQKLSPIAANGTPNWLPFCFQVDVVFHANRMMEWFQWAAQFELFWCLLADALDVSRIVIGILRLWDFLIIK
jgi:hypothetical protein